MRSGRDQGPRSDIERRTAPTVFGQGFDCRHDEIGASPRSYAAAAPAFARVCETLSAMPGDIVLDIASVRQ